MFQRFSYVDSSSVSSVLRLLRFSDTKKYLAVLDGLQVNDRQAGIH